MEDQVITSTAEPTVVENANTSAESTAGLSQVIEQATPMDSNTTYNSLPKTEYQPNMTPVQNLVNDAIQTEHSINQEANAGVPMNRFLTSGYDYDKNEAGSYWVAGAINDNNTQMSFLQTLINEEMYGEMDLQKYYYDTNLATARAYAAQKGKETAYGFYRAAQERALAEGELTGWYMPAEGRYLLGQYTVAQNTLENPEATQDEKNKANRVAKVAEEWFSANQITTRGIKCLAMMNYEENVRHNTVMGELQKQANDIAAQGAAASGAANDLQLRELKFQVEEMELQTGYDFSNAIGLDNDNYIGHKREDYQDLQSLRGYDTVQDMLLNDAGSYAAVLGASSTKFIESVLGDKAKDAYDNYKAAQHDAYAKKAVEDDTYFDPANLDKAGTLSKDSNLKNMGTDKNVYIVRQNTSNGVETRAYYKDADGVYRQITNGNTVLKNGKTISESVSNFTNSTYKYNGTEIQIGTYSKDSVTANSTYYTKMSDKQQRVVSEKEADGWKVLHGYKSTQGIDANIVMQDKEGKYYEVSDVFGKVKEINKNQLKAKDYPEVLATVDSTMVKVGTFDDKAWGKTNVYCVTDKDGNNIYYKEMTRNNSNFRKVTDEELKQVKFNNATLPGATSDITDSTDKTETTKTETKKTPQYVPGTSKNLATNSTNKYDPEIREAIFEEYNVPLIERKEYTDILDPEKLKEKLQGRYNNILGMGGDQNGK